MTRPLNSAWASRPGWPRRGDKMRFLGKNGYDFQLAEASKLFSVGEVLTVEDCDVGDWSHSIKFREQPGRFNGVMFERISDESGEGGDAQP